MMFLSTIAYMFLSYPITVFITFLGTLTLTALVYLKSLFRTKTCVPKCYYKESSLTKQILQKCQTMQSEFRPSLLIRSSHVQTILGFMPGISRENQLSKKYLQMEDYGIVSISEVVNISTISDSAPIVMVLPDYTGSRRLVEGIFEEVITNHYRPILFQGRGQGGNKLTTAKLLNYGDPSDLREVIQYLKYTYPNVIISVVGIGSGADLLMSYCGEYGSSSYLQSAVCISSTFDSETVYSEKIPKFYEILYLSYFKSVISRYFKTFSRILDMRHVLKTWSVNQFTEQFYCKLSGVTNTEEFWEDNSPLRDVDEISTPVLCINSLDDPMCSNDVIPFDLFTSSHYMFLLTTDYGGHAGFVDGPFSKSWIAKSTIEYLKTLLEFTAVQNGHS